MYVPVEVGVKANLIDLPDTSTINRSALLQYKKQQQQIVHNEWLLAKTRKLPLLNFGYNNQSFVGTQTINGVNKTYTAANRFSSYIAGINIPLFTTSIKAKIASAGIRYQAAQVEYEDTLALQKSALQQLIIQSKKNTETLNYYQTSALKNAEILYQNATLQFNNGAINFLEWAMLVNQAISLQAGYIDALNEYNQTVIELNAYSPNFLNQ